MEGGAEAPTTSTGGPARSRRSSIVLPTEPNSSTTPRVSHATLGGSQQGASRDAGKGTAAGEMRVGSVTLPVDSRSCAAHVAEAVASNPLPYVSAKVAVGAIDAGEVEKLRSEVNDLSGEIEEQRLLRQLAECEVSKLRAEADELRRLLRGAERSAMTSEKEARRLASELDESRRAHAKRNPVSQVFAANRIEDVVSALATLELKALNSLSQQERTIAKRRLLLRWHPDKNGSGGGGELATRLMQELQTRPEWYRS